MFYRAALIAVCMLSLTLTSLSVSAESSAGNISYDSLGNPLPVQDPAITGSVPTYYSSKKIVVDLSEQTLTYYGDGNPIAQIKISSGLPRTPTPVGTFKVLAKVPVKEYIGRNFDGSWYDLKNTKWNLKFSNLGYYIHGTYWHNNFGHPMSHGCINVSYADMPQLYEFAGVGTPVIIRR